MHFEASTTYPAAADRVARMLADEGYVRAKVEASGALNSTCQVVGDATGLFTVRTTRTLPTDAIPAQFRKFVGATLEVTLVEKWSEAAANGARSGAIGLVIAGVKAEAEGRAVLSPAAGHTTITYTGEVRVTIPLVGRMVEQAAVRAVQDVLAAEREVALRWLTEQSGHDAQ